MKHSAAHYGQSKLGEVTGATRGTFNFRHRNLEGYSLSTLPERKIRIDWCNLSADADVAIVGPLRELGEQLALHYPALPEPRFSRLPHELTGTLASYLTSLIPGSRPNDQCHAYETRLIFLYCNRDSEVARAYRNHNPMAAWGVAIPRRIAIAWTPEKHLWWHEVMHLFNAKDCYNKFGVDKCEESSCIMQRAPCRANCGDKLVLCSKNRKRIHQFGLDSIS